MMYICLSCYQLKQGDERQLDMNICEDCASDTNDGEPLDNLPDLMFLIDQNGIENPASTEPISKGTVHSLN